MDDYRRFVLASVIAGAAACAHVLSLALPANLAAMTGAILGIVVTRGFDQVGEQFKTDVERILEPNKPAIITAVGTFVCMVLTVSAFAGIMPPVLAAPLGLLAALAAVKKIFEK